MTNTTSEHRKLEAAILCLAAVPVAMCGFWVGAAALVAWSVYIRRS